MNWFFLILEFVLLVTAAVLAVLWARNPQGNFEPFTVLAGLAVGLLEFFRRRLPEVRHKNSIKAEEEIILGSEEERVTFTELLRSLKLDVVKVNAHTHALGVSAEYEWIRRRYPESETLEQALTTLDLISGHQTHKDNQIHFDVIALRLADGRKKEVYFDISSFYGGGPASLLNPSAYIARKLAELYGKKS